jgi:peptidoglycan/xylan/chitin deacetylase (PgdA/CDA1 family)
MKKNGTFIISLDFELHWGCVESKTVLDYQSQQYFINTRNVIPNILYLFDEHNIHATWATVGMLFNKSSLDWQKKIPTIIPTYKNKKVSVYEWIFKNGFLKEDDCCHFAPELIQKIKETKNQELATHTYSHYFCLEKGQTIEQFRQDIERAVTVAKEKDIEITSLVFPRNQYNDQYISVCHEFGIQTVRTCPNVWYWSPTAESGLLRKLFRTGDAYLKINSIPPVFLEDIITDQLPLRLPASRLYRPWTPKLSLLNKLKQKRILQEMTAAAQNGAYYHLWWHPENFGLFPDKCMEELKQIVNHYVYLNKKYGFESYNMHEISKLLLNRIEK